MGVSIAEPVPGVEVAAAAPAPTWVEAAFQDIFGLSEQKRNDLLAKALILATRLSTSQAVTKNADFIYGMRAIKGGNELEHVLAIIQELMDRKPEGTDEQTASEIIQTAIDAGKRSAGAAAAPSAEVEDAKTLEQGLAASTAGQESEDRAAGRRKAATGAAIDAATRAGQDALAGKRNAGLHPSPPSVLKF